VSFCWVTAPFPSPILHGRGEGGNRPSGGWGEGDWSKGIRAIQEKCPPGGAPSLSRRSVAR
jgi:hypothetical protein